MAIEFSGADWWLATGASTDHDFTTTTGTDMLVVCLAINASAASNSVTFNSDALTKQLTADNISDCRAVIWYKLNPDIGTYTLNSSMSSYQATVIGAYNVKGINTSTPFGNSNTTVADSGNSASLDVSTLAGQVVIDCLVNQQTDAADPVEGANQTELFVGSWGTYYMYGCSSYELAVGSTTNMSWSWDTTATRYAYAAIAIIPDSYPSVGGRILTPNARIW